MADQISLGGLTRLPYAIAAQLLDHMTKTNKETEKDQILATLLTLLDLVTKQIMELEVPCKKKDRYIPLHERIKPKEYEGGQIEEILSLILHKVEQYDRVLNEIKENISLLNQMSVSHSMSIQLLETQMGHMWKFGMFLKSGDWRAKCPVGEPDLDQRWTQEIIRLESVKLDGPMNKLASRRIGWLSRLCPPFGPLY
uniref:Uncharacterized protein n=1 Tax=Solanum tuberosum TaxID=4113 RepID=M1DFI7_SOLTU